MLAIFDKWASPHVVRQFLLFAAVGAAATVTHAIVAMAVHERLGFSPLSANAVGYFSAVLISYTGNARLTFKSSLARRHQFARFMAVSLTTLAFNQIIVVTLTSVLAFPFALALVPTIVLVPVISFLLSKIWAFRDPSAKRMDS